MYSNRSRYRISADNTRKNNDVTQFGAMCNTYIYVFHLVKNRSCCQLLKYSLHIENYSKYLFRRNFENIIYIFDYRIYNADVV